MTVFGKKDEDKKGVSDVPIQAVMSMKQRGLNNQQVIEQLKSQGYPLQSINDALTQAEVKQNAIAPAPAPAPAPELPPLPGAETTAPPAPPAPKPAAPKPPMPSPASPVRGGMGLNEPTTLGAPTTMPKAPPVPSGVKVEEIERILEEIVDERWKDVTAKFSDLENSRTRNDTRVDELSKRVTELAGRLDDISTVVMGKVEEYKKTMEDVDVEIKALEKVMQKLVPSMAEQVKELKDVVGGLKGKPLE